MNDDLEFERLLRESLGRTGKPAPFAIDVSDRVMARVAQIGPAPRAEVGTRELVRWAVAASVVGAALVAAAAWQGPSLGDIVGSLGETLAGTTGAAARLAGPAGALATALARTGGAMLETLQALARPLAAIEPLAHALISTVAVVMLGITTFVVARDVRAGVVRKERS